MRSQTGFLLAKWYLDCVSDTGDVFIGYSAELRWKAVTINYSSVLLHPAHAGTTTRTSVRKCSHPVSDRKRITWSFRPLQIEGAWEALAEPVGHPLLESPRGNVLWSCLQPHSRVEVRVGSDTTVSGRGYVEHLEMSLRPWELPIKELRWGRFLSEHDAMVWIDWQGEMPLTLVYRNGRLLADHSVSDQAVTTRGGQPVLALDHPAVLRDGPLISTALAAVPGIDKVAPLKTLRARESKWLSRGTVNKIDGPPAAGWAIHEVVRF